METTKNSDAAMFQGAAGLLMCYSMGVAALIRSDQRPEAEKIRAGYNYIFTMIKSDKSAPTNPRGDK